MVKEAKEGYFDLIITREVSRFARNIVDTIRINGKYFDASMVREKALLALTSSALVSAIMGIAALIIIL